MVGIHISATFLAWLAFLATAVTGAPLPGTAIDMEARSSKSSKCDFWTPHVSHTEKFHRNKKATIHWDKNKVPAHACPIGKVRISSPLGKHPSVTECDGCLDPHLGKFSFTVPDLDAPAHKALYYNMRFDVHTKDGSKHSRTHLNLAVDVDDGGHDKGCDGHGGNGDHPPPPPHAGGNGTHSGGGQGRGNSTNGGGNTPPPPSCAITGYIQSIGGGADGWINRADGTGDAAGAVGWTTNQTEAGIFTFEPCNGSVVNIQCTNCEFTGVYDYLGIVINPNSPDSNLTAGSSDWGFFTLVPQIDVGSVPVLSDSSRGSGAAESAVWQYNATSNALTPQWVNPDSSVNIVYPTEAVYEYLIMGESFIFNGTDQTVHYKFVQN